MKCAVCRSEFCYVCGQDWRKHMHQPGGFDHYACRLGADRSSSSQPLSTEKRFQDAYRGWLSNIRDTARQKVLRAVMLHIVAVTNVGEACASVIQDALDRCMEARAIIQRCYILRFVWTQSEWRGGRLSTWVGELEGATTALETTLGFNEADTVIQESHLAKEGSAQAQIAQIVASMDLRKILPQVIAAAEHISAVSQLSIAVKLQTSRIVDAGRMGFPGNTTTFTGQILSNVGAVLGTVHTSLSADEESGATSRCSIM